MEDILNRGLTVEELRDGPAVHVRKQKRGSRRVVRERARVCSGFSGMVGNLLVSSPYPMAPSPQFMVTKLS